MMKSHWRRVGCKSSNCVLGKTGESGQRRPQGERHVKVKGDVRVRLLGAQERQAWLVTPKPGESLGQILPHGLGRNQPGHTLISDLRRLGP